MRLLAKTVGATTVVLASALSAQTITTSPAGFESAPGADNALRPFIGPDYHNQVIDTTLRGTPLPTIIATNFRRDELDPNATAVARTADVTLFLGHGDASRFQTVFANNYVAAPTAVFTRKPVNLPDWTTGSGSSPEPWTLRLPHDAPFSYNGTDDLVWETVYENATQTSSYRTDRAAPPAGSLYTVGFGVNLGVGCTPTGAAGTFNLVTTIYSHVNANLMRIRTAATNAPANQPTVVNLSWIDENTMIPGLCGVYRAFPVISLPIGSADAAGGIGNQFISFPYQSVFVGQPLVAQAAAIDVGLSPIPIALSQGEAMTFPAAPTVVADYALIYATDVNAAEGTGPVTSIGTTIVGLEQ